MIYLEVPLPEFLRKYPGLRVISVKCSNCGGTLECNRPFVERGYAGLAVEQCPCGKNENMANTRITTSEETKSKWRKLLSNWV